MMCFYLFSITVFNIARYMSQKYFRSGQHDEKASSSPCLQIILVWTTGKSGSGEIALMELADLILLERADNGVGYTSVMKQYQVFLAPVQCC
jgi:hypothetical protein